MGGGMAEGVSTPPTQRLRIAQELLEHPGQVPAALGGVISLIARNVAISNPELKLANSQALKFSVGITGAGWQARVRESAELSLSRLTLGPELAFGLRELVAPAATEPNSSQFGIPMTTYFGEDRELGFVRAVCSGGMVKRGTRDCGVQSELTPNLVLHVTVREDELPSWRARVLHARKLSLRMILEPERALRRSYLPALGYTLSVGPTAVMYTTTASPRVSAKRGTFAGLLQAGILQAPESDVVARPRPHGYS
jgi:hypothetical protein